MSNENRMTKKLLIVALMLFAQSAIATVVPSMRCKSEVNTIHCAPDEVSINHYNTKEKVTYHWSTSSQEKQHYAPTTSSIQHYGSNEIVSNHYNNQNQIANHYAPQMQVIQHYAPKAEVANHYTNIEDKQNHYAPKAEVANHFGPRSSVTNHYNNDNQVIYHYAGTEQMIVSHYAAPTENINHFGSRVIEIKGVLRPNKRIEQFAPRSYTINHCTPADVQMVANASRKRTFVK